MTRSILLLWPLILAVVLLDGCKRAEVTAMREPQVWTDKETGCEYLVAYYQLDAQVKIQAPRMGRDGKQICKEASWDAPQQKRLN